MAKFRQVAEQPYNLKMFNKAHEAAQSGMGEVVLSPRENTPSNLLAIREAYAQNYRDEPMVTVRPATRLETLRDRVTLKRAVAALALAAAIGAGTHFGLDYIQSKRDANVISYDNTTDGDKAAKEACDADATPMGKGIERDSTYLDSNTYIITKSMDKLVIKEEGAAVTVDQGVHIGSLAVCAAEEDQGVQVHVKGSVDKLYTSDAVVLEVEGAAEVHSFNPELASEEAGGYCIVRTEAKDLERTGDRMPTDCDNNNTYHWDINSTSWQDIPDPQAY